LKFGNKSFENRFVILLKTLFVKEFFVIALFALFLLTDLLHNTRLKSNPLLNVFPTIFLFIIIAGILTAKSGKPDSQQPNKKLLLFLFMCHFFAVIGVFSIQGLLFNNIGYQFFWFEPGILGLCFFIFLLMLKLGLDRNRYSYEVSLFFFRLPFFIILFLLLLTLILVLQTIFYPLLPGRADMLPLVQNAADSFIKGLPPYQMYRLPTVIDHVSPVGYLPVTWLLYVPSVLVHIDPRWMQLPATLALSTLTYELVKRKLNIWWSLILLAITLNLYNIWRHDLYLLPYTALLATALFCFGNKRWTMATILFALCICARQTCLPIIPFYFLILWREKGLKQALLNFLIFGVVGAGVIVPFLLWQGETFVYSIVGGTLRWDTVDAKLDSSVFSAASQRAAEGLEMPGRFGGFSLVPVISLIIPMHSNAYFFWLLAWFMLSLVALLAGLLEQKPVKAMGLMLLQMLLFVIFLAGDEVHYASEIGIISLFYVAYTYKQSLEISGQFREYKNNQKL